MPFYNYGSYPDYLSAPEHTTRKIEIVRWALVMEITVTGNKTVLCVRGSYSMAHREQEKPSWLDR
jgi:hypothetical protein